MDGIKICFCSPKGDMLIMRLRCVLCSRVPQAHVLNFIYAMSHVLRWMSETIYLWGMYWYHVSA